MSVPVVVPWFSTSMVYVIVSPIAYGPIGLAILLRNAKSTISTNAGSLSSSSVVSSVSPGIPLPSPLTTSSLSLLGSPPGSLPTSPSALLSPSSSVLSLPSASWKLLSSAIFKYSSSVPVIALRISEILVVSVSLGSISPVNSVR